MVTQNLHCNLKCPQAQNRFKLDLIPNSIEQNMLEAVTVHFGLPQSIDILVMFLTMFKSCLESGLRVTRSQMIPYKTSAPSRVILPDIQLPKLTLPETDIVGAIMVKIDF